MRAPASSGQLVRGFGLWGLGALILNGIIGAGVFALPGSVAQFAGSWAPLAILGVGLAFLPVVLVFAALAGLFDETGGPIIYVREAFGTTAGFQTGWVQCLATTAASAANANVLADYMLRMLPAAQNAALAHGAVVLLAIGLAFAVNLLEIRNSDRWIKLITVAKLTPLVLLVALALPALASGPALLPAGAPASWDMNFLNMAVAGETTLSPQELLVAIKDIEKNLGRKTGEVWAPRELDIDILAYDDVVLEAPGLSIPHRALLDRDFALLPLVELAPDWHYPCTNKYGQEYKDWKAADIAAHKGYISGSLNDKGIAIYG
jgi:2-amino-4-hydroxy-6-hydroxymethyldihydropteridine diphosphokinase